MRLFSVILSFLLIVGCAGTNKTLNLHGNDTIYTTSNQMYLSSNTVVLLNPAMHSTCSGTLTRYQDSPYIITAAHCIRNKRGTIEVVAIVAPDGNIELGLPVIYDIEKDVAVLSPSCLKKECSHFFQRSGIKLQTKHTVGEQVTIVGQQLGYVNALSFGYIAAAAPHSPTGHILLDINAYYGCSGSGVFNKRNELVGIVTHFVGKRGRGVAPFPFATPTSEVLKLLEELDNIDTEE